MRRLFFVFLALLFAINARAQNNATLEKSDSLFAKGVELYKSGNYREAISVFAESDRIDKAELDSASNRRDYSAMWLASCYYMVGDTLKARAVDSDSYCIIPVDRRLTVKSDSLSAIGMRYFNEGRYDKALEYIIECAEKEKKAVGDKHIWYGNTLYILSNVYYNMRDSISALDHLQRYSDIVRSNYGEKSTQYISALSDIGFIYRYFQFENNDEKALRYDTEVYDLSKTIQDTVLIYNATYQLSLDYAQMSDYQEAIRLGTETLLLLEKAFGKEHPDYATSLSNLANYNSSLGNYAEAVQLGTEALQIREKVLGKEHPDYATSLNNLALYNSYLGNYAEAVRLGTEALQIQEKVLGKEHPNYATSLSNLATYHSNLGNYAEAVRLGAEELQIVEKTLGKEHPDYATSLNNLAGYNYYLSNYAEAVRLGTEALQIQEKVLGKEHPNYATSLSNLATYHSNLGNYAEAVRLGAEELQLVENTLGKEHPDYATSLNNLANYHSDLGNYTEAVRLGTEALQILGKVLGKEHPNYAASLNNLANYNAYLGNYVEAVRLGTEALQILGKVLGKEHPSYATSLNNLAHYNSLLGNYAEAVRLGTEALQIWEKVLGKEHPDYATSLNNLAGYNYYLSNYAEAVRLGTEALQIREKVLGKEHPDYATSLSNLATYNAYLGNYAEAVRLGTEALQICEKVFGKEHPDYATSLDNLANYHSDLGNYAEAMQLETEALQIREKVLGKEHPDYATSLSNLADYNSSLGNYTEAVRLGTEALQIREKVLGKGHPDYATSLNNLANYNAYLGNYVEAVRLGTEALRIQEKVLGKEHPDYAASLNNLALYNSYLGNYAEAVRLATEALQIIEKTLGKEHPNYAMSLSNLALYNSYLGNYAEAMRLGTEALQVYEKVLGKEHPAYATPLSNLASYNSSLGNYAEAVRLGTEASQILGKTLGKGHPNYALSLNNLSDYSFRSSDPQNLSRYADEATRIKTNYILKTFADLTASERSLFWQKEEIWFGTQIHLYAYTYPTGSLVSNACNSILLSKGLLLNSEIEMNKLLLESGDEAAVEAYKELQMNRRMLNRLYEKPIAERHMNTDSLEQLVDRMEHDLVQRSKIYGDYTRNLAIGWQDVRQKLGRRDVAVEFVAFPCGSDSIEYAAYVLKADMNAPRMVPLFEAKQLAAIPKENYYTTPRISELVWQKLDAYIEGAENIYFAPAGELYNIAVETVPDYRSDGWISDRQKFHRLSSTRELAVIKEKSGQKEAVLYGGLKYDTDTHTLEEDSKKYPHEREFTLYNIADSLLLRDGAKYLAGTLSEVTDIDRTLESSSIHSTLLIDTTGTEASFKNLSGKKRNMLHIATHGFYWTKSEMPKDMHLGFLMSDNDRPRYVEDKALTRSGLLFSGANNALTGVALPEGVDDGILTAKEISSLDLRGLDLVVLSACQTGLGEITGDGVFGLQRGFKKAGANALMMSLWKVDDKATQMLMSQFYKNLIAGKSKYESLREAQRYVREFEQTIETKETTSGHRPVTAREREEARKNEQKQTTYKTVKPYRDPKYWAAFILLDGIK